MPRTVVNIMLDAALRYARAGYNVVILHGVDPKTKRCTCHKGSACPAAGKHPRLQNWTKDATRDPAVLTKLFTQYPRSNVGVMPQPGTVVVDVDPRNGGRVDGLDLPARTPTQLTGGGGTHHIVRVADGAVLPKLAGVDYRFPGKHQIVVEPSIHVSGGRYAWAKGLGFGLKPAAWQAPVSPGAGGADHVAPLSSTAPELAPLVPVKEVLDAPLSMAEDWLRHISADEYGDWINIGQALKHAYGDDGMELWDEWSSKSSKYPGRAALESKWDSFDKNRDRALRTLRSVRHMAQRAGWRYTPPELDFSSDLWRSGLVADLVAQPAPPMQWVVGHTVPRGKVVMLAGPGGAGKSFLQLILAAQHATGVNLMGSEAFAPIGDDTQRKVLMFTAEDDRDDVHRRLHSVFDAYTLSNDMRARVGANVSVQCTRGKDWRLVEEVGGVLVASKAADLIIDKLRGELGLSMLMFDPSIMFAGIEENDNAAAAAYMRVLDNIARSLNVSIVVGTHSSKGAVTADSVDQSSVRGASAFVDNARGAWFLRTMTEDEAALRGVAITDRHRFACLRITKNNYGPTGAEVWMERVGGGALRVAAMPSLNNAQGTAAPVAAAGKAQAKQLGRRAAAMQAYAQQVLQYVQQHADPLVGGVALSLRALGKDLWSVDASLSSHGMLDRARRVIDFCEGQKWLEVKRPNEDERGAHAPCTYVITSDGKEQIE